jgi:hypothetical protein
MELKSFKGMPHELGGIDYTEGAEVEGGEYAVKIGKTGNEYIFDKKSSEGDFLAKEYKKLNSNDRLLEDDPIALATFEQIARDQALTHAQRSVNEKGVDPFRNMYEEGQAKNGGVKYATGGTRHALYGEGKNEPTGSQLGSMGQYVDAPSQPEDRMRHTSFGDQNMRLESDNVAYRGATTGEAVGWTIMDVLFSPLTTAFTGKSPSEMGMADAGIRSDSTTRNALGDQSSVGSGFGIGFAESEGVISDMGTQFFNMMGDDGGAMPKNKYAQGGASGQKDMYMGGGGFDFSSMMGGGGGGGMSGGGGGTPWMKIFEAIHNFRQGIKQVAGPGVDNKIAREMGDEYVRQPLVAGNTTSDSGIGDFFSGMAIDKKGGNTTQGDAEAMKAILNAMTNETEIDYSALGSVYNMQNPDENLLAGSFGGYGSEYNSQGFSGSNQLGGDSLLTPVDFGGSSAFGGFKNGGAKKDVYGYYANGGGKKKEELLTGPTGPTSDTGATGVAVSPTGAAYSSDQMSLDNRGVGSSDYGMIPANLEQYARTFFGASEPFTEKDLSLGEVQALLAALEQRKESHTLGYEDFDRAGSQDIYEAKMSDLLTKDPNVMRSLLGKAAVNETPDYYQVTSDYDFAKGKSFSDIDNTMDFLGYLHNMSPFVDEDAVSKKNAVNIRIPKNRK